MSNTHRLLPGFSALQPASQPSQDLAKHQQAPFFAQNKSGLDSKEVWIVVMRPEGEQENKTAASPIEAKTTSTKSLPVPDKNKGKVSGKKEQTAPPPNLPVTVPGAGVTVRRSGASKENVLTAHSNRNPLINLALPADRSGARVSSTPTSGSLFASLMAPSMQDLQMTGQNSVGVRPEVGALASNAASQFTEPAVTCSSSMLTRLLTTNLQDLQGPMATSTPVQRKRPAVMATEAKSTPPAAKTSRQVCARKNVSNLPSDMPVLTFDNLNSCNLPSSHVSTQGAFSFNSSSVSASVPLDHSSTIAVSSSTQAYPVLTFLSQPFSTSTPVLHRSPATESPKLHHFHSLSTELSSTNPTWTPSFGVSTPSFGVATPSFGVATPRRSFREQMSDSGIGASVGSLALTPVRMEGGLESDAGATCSSWAASDDSNHMTVDLTVDNLSQGSVEENSNSQGDDGELNTSLTKMIWLKDFALKKKPVVTDPLLSAEGPVNRRLESRPNKVFCICRSQSGWQPEVETLRKPPFKYKDLIEMALLSTPTLTMTSREIRSWFVKNFTFFKRHEKCGFWQNAIRHNLSSNDCFVRSTTQKRHWTLDTTLSTRGCERKLAESMSLPVMQPMLMAPGVQRSLGPEPVMLGSQPLVWNSALPVSSLHPETAPSFYNNAPRITSYPPILPRSAMRAVNTNNPTPAFIRPNPSMLLHIPSNSPCFGQTLPTAFSPLNAVAVTAPVPKLPLPPLSATVNSVTANIVSAKKKSSGGAAVAKGKAGKHGANCKGKKAKSVSACSMENNLLVQAAMESGLTGVLSQEGGGEDVLTNTERAAACLTSVHTASAVRNGDPTSTSQDALSRNPTPWSASLPPILCKPAKSWPPNVDVDEAVNPERTGSNACPTQQQSRGRRKQNLRMAQSRETELIITGSEWKKKGSSNTKPARTVVVCDDEDSDTSLNLVGPEAAELQLSPLMTPPGVSPRLSQIAVESPASGTSLALDTSTPVRKLKVGMESLPSPIRQGESSSSQAAPMDHSSLMDILDSLLPQEAPPAHTPSPDRDPTLAGNMKKLAATPNKLDPTAGRDMPGLMTPPSALFRTSASQPWSMRSFGDTSLGLLATPGNADLGVSSFSNLWDFPEDLSLTDQSPAEGGPPHHPCADQDRVSPSAASLPPYDEQTKVKAGERLGNAEYSARPSSRDSERDGHDSGTVLPTGGGQEHAMKQQVAVEENCLSLVVSSAWLDGKNYSVARQDDNGQCRAELQSDSKQQAPKTEPEPQYHTSQPASVYDSEGYQLASTITLSHISQCTTTEQKYSITQAKKESLVAAFCPSSHVAEKQNENFYLEQHSITHAVSSDEWASQPSPVSTDRGLPEPADPQPQLSNDKRAMRRSYMCKQANRLSRSSLSRNLFPQGAHKASTLSSEGEQEQLETCVSVHSAVKTWGSQPHNIVHRPKLLAPLSQSGQSPFPGRLQTAHPSQLAQDQSDAQLAYCAQQAQIPSLVSHANQVPALEQWQQGKALPHDGWVGYTQPAFQSHHGQHQQPPGQETQPHLVYGTCQLGVTLQTQPSQEVPPAELARQAHHLQFAPQNQNVHVRGKPQQLHLPRAPNQSRDMSHPQSSQRLEPSSRQQSSRSLSRPCSVPNEAGACLQMRERSKSFGAGLKPDRRGGRTRHPAQRTTHHDTSDQGVCRKLASRSDEHFHNKVSSERAITKMTLPSKQAILRSVFAASTAPSDALSGRDSSGGGQFSVAGFAQQNPSVIRRDAAHTSILMDLVYTTHAQGSQDIAGAHSQNGYNCPATVSIPPYAGSSTGGVHVFKSERMMTDSCSKLVDTPNPVSVAALETPDFDDLQYSIQVSPLPRSAYCKTPSYENSGKSEERGPGIHRSGLDYIPNNTPQNSSDHATSQLPCPNQSGGVSVYSPVSVANQAVNASCGFSFGPSGNGGACTSSPVGEPNQAVSVLNGNSFAPNQIVDLHQQFAAYNSGFDVQHHISASQSDTSHMAVFFDSLINTPPAKQQQHYSHTHSAQSEPHV